MRRLLLGLLVLLGGVTPAGADTLLYFRESGAPRFLVNFDTATGVSTVRSEVLGTERLFGLDFRPSDDTLFAIALSGGLFTLNPDTGTPSLVGNTGIREPVGLTFNPSTGALLALSNEGQLFSLNPATGASSLIGNTGQVQRGISFSPAGDLFGFSLQGDLFRVNPLTGAPTFVGSSGVPITLIAEDSTFTPDGRLFLADFGGNIFQINPATGNRTLVGQAGPGQSILGLATLPAALDVPEPSSVALLGLGALGLAAFGRRRSA